MKTKIVHVYLISTSIICIIVPVVFIDDKRYIPFAFFATFFIILTLYQILQNRIKLTYSLIFFCIYATLSLISLLIFCLGTKDDEILFCAPIFSGYYTAWILYKTIDKLRSKKKNAGRGH